MSIRAWYVIIYIWYIDIEYIFLIVLIWDHYYRIEILHSYRIIRFGCVNMIIVVIKWCGDSIFLI